MEKSIEKMIDHALESISTQLHIFSIGAGVILLLLGLIFLLIRKSSTGFICFVIGVLAIVSGTIQLF